MTDKTAFTVVKTADRWSLVDPGGAGIVSIGVTHADETNLMYPHNLRLWQERQGRLAARRPGGGPARLGLQHDQRHRGGGRRQKAADGRRPGLMVRSE
ncbi:hypothetical protein ABZS71_27880 [Streptomyces sp. NPDC005393]|uniref:hypothetical protein n=1 Tax=Streptomyces sp. NPDC005393 TaxID=3157041 RepID=UPI0033A0D1E3